MHIYIHHHDLFWNDVGQQGTEPLPPNSLSIMEGCKFASVDLIIRSQLQYFLRSWCVHSLTLSHSLRLCGDSRNWAAFNDPWEENMFGYSKLENIFRQWCVS